MSDKRGGGRDDRRPGGGAGPVAAGKRGPRKALTNVGGAARVTGDRAIGKLLLDATRIPREDAPGERGGRDVVGPRSLTHGFHPWPARLHPHMARVLTRGAPAGAIADPFMGGGTVPVEAVLAGRRFFGGDVNPVAVEVAWARTRLWPRERIEGYARRAERWIEHARPLRDRRVDRDLWAREAQWYDPPALIAAWSLVKSLQDAPHDEITRMLRATLSAILVKASRQASDSVTKQDDRHTWVPAERVDAWLVAKAQEHARDLAALVRAAPRDAPEPTLALRDARAPHDDAAGIGAIISSPPYPGVYDYVSHHERRYALLGLDARLATRAEIGARRTAKQRGAATATAAYERALSDVLAGWRPRMAPRGLAFFAIGDGQDDKGPIAVLPLLRSAAAKAGWKVAAVCSQRRPTFGPKARRQRAKEEHLVALALAGGAGGVDSGPDVPAD